jgi:hypothetical protein
MDSTLVENHGIISDEIIKWTFGGIGSLISFLLGKYFLHDRKKASDKHFVATMEAQKDVLTAQKDALKSTIEVQTEAHKKDVEATFKNDEKEKESKQGAVELWKDIATEMKVELAILRTEQKLLLSQIAELTKNSGAAEGTVISLREKITHLEQELEAWKERALMSDEMKLEYEQLKNNFAKLLEENKILRDQVMKTIDLYIHEPKH